MDHLFTPWRYAYVTTADKAPGCLFCDAMQAADEHSVWVLHRAQHCFILLNAFPYTSGHVMIAPYAHVDELRKLPAEAAHEMVELAQWLETILREAYKPDGLNVGMNIGRSAGAGVAQHIHLHVLPRWTGDSSFMTSVGETRVLPEALEITYQRLKAKFEVRRKK